MPLNPDALTQTQRAFDAAADVYDAENADNPVLCEMRNRTVAAVMERLPPGASLLDLGCGPGPDALHLGRNGYRVLAIDWSPKMALETERRVRAAGLEERIEVRRLGAHELERLNHRTFDGVYSNLGPLNCVPDLGETALTIATRLVKNGIFVASVIGRICPWEIALYGLGGDWNRVRVRFSRDFVPVPFKGHTIWTRYYDPAEFECAFERAGLETLSLRSLGILVPPPYLTGFAKRHRKWIARLQRLEDRLAFCPGIRRWGDHFLIVMRKRSPS